MIVVDFSMLSQNKLMRCAYQLANLAEIADRMHLPVKVVIAKGQETTQPILKRVKHLLSDNYKEATIYIAKSDTFFYDDNWKNIADLPAFKVCLNSSDRLFRERTAPWHGRAGTAVQTRCDLYMPVNCSPGLMHDYSHNTIPVAHRVSTQFFDFLAKSHLDHAFLDDDINTIRDTLKRDTIGLAGFMGNGGYGERRRTGDMPDWANLTFKWSAPAAKYVDHMLSYKACVDIRGNGDKSIRFVEAVLLGRTILTKPQGSHYYPQLVDGHNAIIVSKWADLKSRVDLDLWQRVADQATKDYLEWWSQLAQFRIIIERAKDGRYSP
jgi:hypothetical protein